MKSEKEKMLSGELYLAFGDELLNERQFSKQQIHIYNTLDPTQLKERIKILNKLLGSVGTNTWIEPPFRCDYGYNISVGDNFYANYNLTVLDCAKVSIGKNVLIGPNVGLYAAGHPIDPELRNTGKEYAFPIIIGDNVWIGGHVSINPGITIGNNVVIGSGSVVTKDIPDNSIAAGNPCKVIRVLNDDDKMYYFKNKKINNIDTL